MSDGPALQERELREQAAIPAPPETADTGEVPHHDAVIERDLKTIVVWVVGHAGRLLPLLIVAVVVAVTWDALRRIHFGEVRAALRGMDQGPILVGLAITAVNIAVMGLYDVVAFRLTRAPWPERWRFGSVAFAWSNFLTLGPLAGPAIRFWLYRPWVDRATDVQGGVVSVVLGFTAGLVGWTVASLLPIRLAWAASMPVLLVVSLVTATAVVLAGATVLSRTHPQFATRQWRFGVAMVLVGWVDWLLAALAFSACVHALPVPPPDAVALFRSFFVGQAIGLLSLIPGGLGSSDAFWVAHLPVSVSAATAALLVYRAIYYVLPWLFASAMLLGWATSRSTRRIDLARRFIATLVGAGGLLMILSTASPALAVRLRLLERVIPLELVEFGYLAAALGGLLLLVLARGLAKGYRSAVRAAYLIIITAAAASLLKGLDWEEVVILSAIALVLWTQSALFDRPSHGDWLERRDLWLAVVGVFVFVVVGAVTHRVNQQTIDRLLHVGYHVEGSRFARSAITLAMGTAAVALYTLLRAPVRFARPSSEQIQRTLELHARIGRGSTALTVANGDKQIWTDGDRGFCLYRTIGRYIVVFADPVVQRPSMHAELLDRFIAFAAELDRRPLFYQISPEWIPPLHDRGYAFFKLGEEALVPLERVTLEGHAGKINRQILKRAERDRARFRIIPPEEAQARIGELRHVSDEWLRIKEVRERQFSIGYFDEEYIGRFPCGVVEYPVGGPEPLRIIAFANLLLGPAHSELSVDLMRYVDDAPKVMDYLFVSLFLYGKELGYRTFNLGMAPLASVGERTGAYARERLARLVFQHGENWYNFQGLRYYKQKWNPEWVPRYLAYENPWDWPAALANVSALIAGGWSAVATARFK